MDPNVPLATLLHPDNHTATERRQALATLRTWLFRGGHVPEDADRLHPRTLRALGLAHLIPACSADADDRDAMQRETHCVGVVMNDRYLSHWGKAENGTSVAVWACTPTDAGAVERAVRGRSDARHVRVVDLRTWRRPKGAAHVHIYVVGPGHPARTGSFRIQVTP